jgi:tRNA G26 N,N-dimethylase Trm1
MNTKTKTRTNKPATKRKTHKKTRIKGFALRVEEEVSTLNDIAYALHDIEHEAKHQASKIADVLERLNDIAYALHDIEHE